MKNFNNPPTLKHNPSFNPSVDLYNPTGLYCSPTLILMYTRDQKPTSSDCTV